MALGTGIETPAMVSSYDRVQPPASASAASRKIGVLKSVEGTRMRIAAPDFIDYTNVPQGSM